MNAALIEMKCEDASIQHSLAHALEDKEMGGDSSEEATTTGDSSDNDSASESDGEIARNAGRRKRHAPPTAGDIETRLAPSDFSGPIDSRSCWQSQSVQLPQRRRRRLEHHFEHHHQPLPRKAYHATSAGLAQESLLPQAGRDNIGIEENAQLGQRAMGPAHRAVSYQGHIRGQDSSRRTQKSSLVTMTPRGSQAPGGTSSALKPLQEVCMAGETSWKKRILAPVKAANSKEPPQRRPVPSACSRLKEREGSADISAELMPPPLPRVRMASSAARSTVGEGSRNIESRGKNSSWEASEKSSRIRSRLISSTLPPLAQEERSAVTATKRGIIPDLSCHEVFDVDSIMNPGEVRTPICRYLLPCWPEGVEGYEEVGGWRRLGGATRGSSQREKGGV